VKVRFLADADLTKAIVSGVLRSEPSIDFLTAHAAGLRRMKDTEVLALAAAKQRVLVSHLEGAALAYSSSRKPSTSEL
jgi:predicted nuclease of predicted toxin-antitoxin system